MDLEHWSGFTDVELNSLKQRGRGRRNALRSRGQPLNQGTRKIVYPIGRAGSNSKANIGDLPPSAYLSSETKPDSANFSPANERKTEDVNSSAAEKSDVSDVVKDTSSAESSGDSGVALTESPPTSLEEMQKQQKVIEELNKKKKAMLQETIQQRYKQTQQESKTLTVVNQELSKLDSMISSEINVLRERIEEANRHYNNARKRFERAEKEYIEAKMALHQSTESKELLAEHLCAVIQENEIRKAKKLEELMVKLNMAVSSGDEGSTSPKVLLYQRTPTPRYEHWPQNPTMDHSNSKTVANIRPTTLHYSNVEKQEDIGTVTNSNPELNRPPHSDCTSDSSHDPIDGSHGPTDGSHGSTDGSHDFSKGLHNQEGLTADSSQQISDGSSHDPAHDSQDSSSQANS